MMKLLKFFIAILLPIAAFSCKKDGDGIKVSVSSLEFKSSEQKQTVNIVAGCGWTAKADCDWIVCSPSSGEGNATLSVTAKANDGLEREGTVTVSGNGNLCDIAVNRKAWIFPSVRTAWSWTRTARLQCLWSRPNMIGRFLCRQLRPGAR